MTAVNDTVDAPDKPVTVSGTAAGGNNVANPPNVTLTDDEALPTVALAPPTRRFRRRAGFRR